MRPGIKLVNTMSNETLDEAGVVAKFGVRADQVLDLLALTGDAVDNVPGVPKVGPKTAAKWLAQYGTLDARDRARGRDSGRRRRQPARDARLAAAGQAAADREDRLRACRVAPTDLGSVRRMPDRLRPLYERFEFKSWLRDGKGRGSRRRRRRGDRRSRGAPEHADFCRCGCARCGSRRRSAAARFRATTRPCWTRRRSSAGCRRSSARSSCASIPRRPASTRCGADRRAVLRDRAGPRVLHPARAPLSGRRRTSSRSTRRSRASRRWFADPARKKLGQNVKYDQHVLANHGLPLDGVAHDTLLQSYVLEAHRPHDMDNLAWRHLNVKTIAYAEVAGKGREADRLRPGEHRRRDGLLGRGCRHHAAAAPLPVPARRRRPEARPRLHGDRDAGARGPVRDGARRRDARHGAARRAEPRARREGDGARAAGLPARRAAVQPRVAEAAGRDPVRQDEAADAAQDGDRPAVDGRGRADRARRRLPAAEGPARASRAVEAEVDLHGQAAADGESAHRSRAHDVQPGDGGHRPARVVGSESAEHPGAHGRRAGASARRSSRRRDT